MLDFPDSPVANDTFGASNGVTYTFDGTKWTVSGSSIGPYLLLSGGTMGGPIALAADPTTDPQAANKHYVDASINLAGNYLGTWSVAANSPNISAGGSISNANYVATTVVPGTPETVPVGVPGIAGMTVANGDRVIWASGLGTWQILRNAGVTLAAADARYYAISNPSGYQTAANVTTALVPYAPLASPPLTGNPTAPTPTYGDNDTSIATTAFVQAAVAPDRNNVGRNLIHNALFNMAQRGTGAWTGVQYTVDRWLCAFITDTSNIGVASVGDADRAAIGDESARSLMSCNVIGNATAGSQTRFAQFIEDVRRLSGKTVTVSFYAIASGVLKLGVNFVQNFGSGGSPSSVAEGNGQSVILSGTWTRYSLTFAIPSIAGKTLGGNGNDYTALQFWYSAASSLSGPSGSVGVQSGAVNLWGVQLEIGSVATPLDYGGSPQQQLAECQRFYQVVTAIGGAGYSTSATVVQQWFPLPMRMRAAPTFTPTWGTNTNYSPTVSGNEVGYLVGGSTTGTGQWGFNLNTLAASADL